MAIPLKMIKCFCKKQIRDCPDCSKNLPTFYWKPGEFARLKKWINEKVVK